MEALPAFFIKCLQQLSFAPGTSVEKHSHELRLARGIFKHLKAAKRVELDIHVAQCSRAPAPTSELLEQLAVAIWGERLQARLQAAARSAKSMHVFRRRLLNDLAQRSADVGKQKLNSLSVCWHRQQNYNGSLGWGSYDNRNSPSTLSSLGKPRRR